MENKDEYQISTSMNDGIAEIVVTGKVTGHNISEFQSAIHSIRVAKSDRILLDVRFLNGKSIDTFYHVRRPERAVGRTAVVDLPENEHIKTRCENIARDTSLEIKWFSDIDAARNWLRHKAENRKNEFQELVHKFVYAPTVYNPESENRKKRKISRSYSPIPGNV